MDVPPTPYREMRVLLGEAFSRVEMHRFLNETFRFVGIVESLPGEAASDLEYFGAVVDVLERHGYLNAAFFDLLANERPGKRQAIHRLSATWQSREVYTRLAMPQAAQLEYTLVGIDTRMCLWEPLQQGRGRWQYESNQLPTFCTPDALADNDPRSQDPVFDVTLVNRSASTMVIIALGFVAREVWVDTKGLGISGQLLSTGTYILDVEPVETDVEQSLRLEDPLFLLPQAPLRFRLHLRGYRAAVPGNQSIMQLITTTAFGPYHSPLIYMGLF